MSEMEVKPGYKQTEVGVIPEDWVYVKLGDVISECFGGSTPSRYHPEYYNGNIRWITSGELNYNVINDTIEKITPEAVEKTNLRFVPKNAILIAITGLEAEGTRGSCGIVGEESTTNQSCMTIIPNKSLFFLYFFHYYVYRGKTLALQYCQGTKQQSYTAGLVKLLPILLPPLPEQTAVATALSDVDALISGLDRLIEKKRAIKQAAMQELLTGKRRLPGFDSGKGYKQTEVGEIPEDWEVKNCDSICERISVGVVIKPASYYKENGAIALRSLNIDSDSFNLDNLVFFSNQDNSGLLAKSKLKERDIVVVRTGYPGTSAVISKELEGSNCIDLLILRVIKEKIDPYYISKFFNSECGKKAFSNHFTGLAQLHLNVSAIKKTNIPLPPLPEQTAIATVLSDMDAEISALETRKAKTISLKQGMMQELLTGRIRLV